MSKFVNIRETTEKIYHWTFEIRSTEHIGELAPHGLGGLGRASTDGLIDGAYGDDSNWPFAGCRTSDDFSFVIMHVDAVAMSGFPTNLREVLAAIKFKVIINQRPEIERALADITVHDKVLEARVAVLEDFVREFLRLNDPTAEAMRMLGGKMLDRAPLDLRRLVKPVLVGTSADLHLRVEWKSPIAVPEPVVMQVRLHGILRQNR